MLHIEKLHIEDDKIFAKEFLEVVFLFRKLLFRLVLNLLLFCTIYNFFVDWNRNFSKRSFGQELKAILQYNIIMLLVTEFIMYFLKWADVFSRAVMILFPVLNILLGLTIHLTYKKILRMHFSSEQSVSRVLVVAQADVLETTVARLHQELEINYKIVALACLDENVIGKEICGIPVIASEENLLEKATQMAFDEAFIITPGMSQDKVEHLIQGFFEMGVECHYSLELSGITNIFSKVDTFADYNVVTYTHFQSSYKRLLIKRVMDMAGGLVGMLITLLFTPFVALAIKLDSPGPVFFSQVRIGRNGRRFRIYKFRSMYLDAEERKKELENQNEIQGLMFKIENDPRITRVGKFIRKTSIDELPQFLNVLKGDMSLVGTRPPTEDEFEKYTQYYRRRISMTPGLTGLWQVSGRSEVEDFDDVVKYDLKYIDSWSLLLDVKILFRTVKVVLFREGSK